jgi:precorrin-6B methylase 2
MINCRMERGESQVSDSIEQRIKHLSKSVRELALIGAWLKLQSGKTVEPLVREQVELGARMAFGFDPPTLAEEQAEPLLTTIGMALAESGELFNSPERGANWQVADVELLRTQGRASRSVVNRILSLAESRPAMQEALKGAFLDVGTGVAGIALEAAKTCPNLQVDGIDIWDPALAIAEENVRESPYADRVRIMKLDVANLDVQKRYTLVWLPTMFLSRSVLERALDRIAAASKSGAYLIAAIYTLPEDPFMAVVSTLRTIRSGGEVSSPSELEAMLKSRGYANLERNVAPIATLVVGKLP